MTPEHRANRLAGETSPYLLQHAHNPVDWYPWGLEALERARTLDRPIFLSIGYAACHWCHVMERESFEDAATAAQLNADFVAIKVDREERPDLDQVYMTAVQAMTGQGGWPMSLFLTPDGRPFYGGTYFPDSPRHGMPSFREVLTAVASAWQVRRDELETAGTRLIDSLAHQHGLPGADASGESRLPDPTALIGAVAALEATFDAEHGGWGGAPKFPQPMTIEFLLRRWVVAGDARALAMARRTLDRMADGGIHDQLGGGFHRYATDAIWLVPHFEKMLYDNAQLARAYAHAFEATGDERYLEVATDTMEYVRRELTTADGLWAASQDADTDGEEGLTYVWSLAEVEALLGPDAELFATAYDVSAHGNWEGASILRRVRSDGDVAADLGRPVAEVADRLARARATLLAARAGRPQPARDDKALAAWNGLMLAAFADAGRALAGRTDSAAAAGAEWIALARSAAQRVLDVLRAPDGGLARSWKDGRASQRGVLEDSADLAEGLLALYAATFEERWFVAARELMDDVLEHFADPAGGFFDTSDRHETLVTRPKDVQDNAVPSGNAMTATVLLKLSALTGESRYRDAAERAIGQVSRLVERYPGAFGQWLVAIEFALAPVTELAIAGDPADPATLALLATASDGFRPHQVVAVAAEGSGSAIELLHDRPGIDGRPTAYVCRGFACRRPTTDAAQLAIELEGAVRA